MCDREVGAGGGSTSKSHTLDRMGLGEHSISGFASVTDRQDHNLFPVVVV
jgi:hypothetical protein